MRVHTPPNVTLAFENDSFPDSKVGKTTQNGKTVHAKGDSKLGNDNEKKGDTTGDLQEDFGGVSKRMRLVKTGCMVGTGFAMGVPGSIIGPTMLELKELLNADFGQISLGPTALSVGILIGCFLSGVICDKFRPHTDLLVFIGSLMIGGCIGLVPWWPSLPLFYILMIFGGIGVGVARTAAFTLTNLMWGERSSAALHVVSAGTTVGLMSSPLLARPFLSEETDQIASAGNMTTIVSTEVDDPEQIRFVYIIVGILMVVMSFPFLVFYLVGPLYTARKKTRLSVKEALSPDTYSPGRPVFGVVFTTVFFIIFSITYAHASVIAVFLFTISVDDYGVSKKLSASLLVVVFAMEVIGKVVFGFISKCVRIQIIVMLQLFLTSIFAVGLTIGQTNAVYLWVLAIAQQFFCGALYGSYVPWGDRYVEFTGVITSISQIATAVGFGVGAAITGLLYEHYGQHALWYFFMACCFGLIVLTVPLQIVAARAGERFDKDKNIAPITQDTRL